MKTLIDLELVHDRLGAKYPIAHADFHRAIDAAIERPHTMLGNRSCARSS